MQWQGSASVSARRAGDEDSHCRKQDETKKRWTKTENTEIKRQTNKERKKEKRKKQSKKVKLTREELNLRGKAAPIGQLVLIPSF